MSKRVRCSACEKERLRDGLGRLLPCAQCSTEMAITVMNHDGKPERAIRWRMFGTGWTWAIQHPQEDYP